VAFRSSPDVEGTGRAVPRIPARCSAGVSCCPTPCLYVMQTPTHCLDGPALRSCHHTLRCPEKGYPTRKAGKVSPGMNITRDAHQVSPKTAQRRQMNHTLMSQESLCYLHSSLELPRFKAGSSLLGRMFSRLDLVVCAQQCRLQRPGRGSLIEEATSRMTVRGRRGNCPWSVPQASV
jgi:hypothetical protein